MDLRERFAEDLGSKLTSTDAQFAELEKAYTESRYYHNLRHIENCLDFFECVAHNALYNQRAIKASIYYHDIVYDSTRNDNEERSADVAAKRLIDLGYHNGFAQKVRAIIIATKHRGDADGIDEQIMCDVDLAELAADWATFSANTAGIRKEFGWVSEPDWRKGRSDFMRGLLARPQIYYTRPFQKLFEARARENIARTIAELEAA